MNDKRTVQILIALSQLELDALRACEHALRRSEDLDTRQMVNAVYQDHSKHRNRIHSVLGEGGHTIPEQSPCLYGMFRDPAATLRSMKGTREILDALRITQKVVIKTYSDALEEQILERVRAQMHEILLEEKQTLQSIMNMQAQIYIPEPELSEPEGDRLFAA